MRIVNLKDFLAGAMFIAFGVGFAFLAPGYALGTPARMGAGFFPLVLGLCLCAIGLAVLVTGLTAPGEAMARVKLRPLVALIAAIVLFGVLLRPVGLVGSILVLVLAGGFASPDFRFKEGIVLAIGLAIGSALLFVALLGLPMPLWPSF